MSPRFLLTPLLFLPPNYTLTSTRSVGWGSSEATCFFSTCCSSELTPEALAAQYWGLLNFAFLLHSYFMTPSSNASHSSRLLFPPRTHFQVTCLGHFPTAQLLTFAHLPVTLRALTWETRPVQNSENCEHYPCPSDSAWGQRWMGEWCCGRNFYLQTRPFHPLPHPHPSPWRGGNRRGGLTGRIWSQTPVWPKPSPAFGPPWSASVCGGCCLLFLHQAYRALSQSPGPHSPHLGLNTRFH